MPAGLKCHPDQEHLVYPLGCTILIQALNTQEQNFLHGHGNNVSCATISKSGVYLASGQVTFMGFKVNKLKNHSFSRDLAVPPKKNCPLQNSSVPPCLHPSSSSFEPPRDSFSSYQAESGGTWRFHTRWCDL